MMRALFLPALLLVACAEGGPRVREARLPDSGIPLPGTASDKAPVDTGLPAVDSDPGADTDPEPIAPAATDVCFLGANRAGTTCFPTVPAQGLGSDYAWPTASDARYRTPARVIDLNAVDLSTSVAPNFAASEFLQTWKGPYGVLQPHAVARLQTVRDRVGGAVQVNSGFRSPAYNASIDGAEFSRHMYGDAADVFASSLSVSALGALCEDEGAGYVGYYEGHVHCDWRDDPLDPVLYGPSFAPPMGDDTPALDGWIEVVDGVWRAPATGWDEGEPLREWEAFDAVGRRMAGKTGRTFVPPPGAASVSVVIGRAVSRVRGVP